MTEQNTELNPAAPAQSLPADRLYRRCDPAELSFATTDELEPLAAHLGQDRAVEALAFGLQIPHEGFNIFVLGSTGVGKKELLFSLLDDESAAPLGEVSDWCYVNNFESPDKPVALRLPKGMGCQLRDDMATRWRTCLAASPPPSRATSTRRGFRSSGRNTRAGSRRPSRRWRKRLQSSISR